MLQLKTKLMNRFNYSITIHFILNNKDYHSCWIYIQGPFRYNLFLLKTENWKHFSKTIFKCVNSAVEPIFNEKMAEKCMNSTKQCVNSNCIVWTVTSVLQLKRVQRKKKKKKAKMHPSQNVDAIISIQTAP